VNVVKKGALLACLLIALAPAAQAAGASGFGFGVAAGDVTTTSARLWTRADESGRMTLRLSRKGHVVQRYNARADPANDNTVQVRVHDLRPGTRYSYGFHMRERASDTGVFETAPRPSQRRTIAFAFSGDADGALAPGSPGSFYNDFEVYARMNAERNDFNINLGDTIYSDSEIGGLPPALTVADKWVKYKQNLSYANFQLLRRSGALYSEWDDHEFANDFSLAEGGAPLYDAGKKAFLDYAPASYSPRLGLYRKFRWGRNLELFILDERSFRSAKASAGAACDNPFGSIESDLAPTAPQRLRNAFGFVIPALRKPAPKPCLDAIADPGRTFLGRIQLRRFLRDVRRSRATFKAIVNETPIQQFYALPYDRWEGYAAERKKVVEALRAERGVVFLATDTHANMVTDVRLRTLEPGGPRDTGILEAVTGPVATKTFAREIDETTGISGAGNTVGRLFFKPPPPAGVGMRCAALDIYSYGEVNVTSRRLTITPKDIGGKPVREPGGRRCGPYRVGRR
jgi:phosphodiesterase/alkaline phosphatase D-like protein